MIQQTIVIDADEYNTLSAEVKACRANVRAAFALGVQAASKLVREWAANYPISIFPKPPKGKHGDTVDACSAETLRVMLPIIADAIDELLPEMADAVPPRRPAAGAGRDGEGERDEMNQEEHEARHKQLHEMLDELVDDYMAHTGKRLRNSTVMELMLWSAGQIEAPMERIGPKSHVPARERAEQ